MPEFFVVIWDDSAGGNIEHLAEHGVTPDEAEYVIRGCFHDREPSRSRPERWEVEGFTEAGRYLVVIFEHDEDTDVIIPVTAYEPGKES